MNELHSCVYMLNSRDPDFYTEKEKSIFGPKNDVWRNVWDSSTKKQKEALLNVLSHQTYHSEFSWDDLEPTIKFEIIERIDPEELTNTFSAMNDQSPYPGWSGEEVVASAVQE